MTIVRLRSLDTNSISAQTSVSLSLGGRIGEDRGATTNLAASDWPIYHLQILPVGGP